MSMNGTPANNDDDDGDEDAVLDAGRAQYTFVALVGAFARSHF